MGIATNCLLLLVTLFTGNWIYTVISRNVSEIPHITATWSDWLERKPKRSIIQRGYDTARFGRLTPTKSEH
jgi:hypothetical protein